MKQPPRQRVSTGSPFEQKVGVSRAVRSGSIIAVKGTGPLGGWQDRLKRRCGRSSTEVSGNYPIRD